MLAHYEVLRTLSEGAAAEVLLARSEVTHEQVIVELLRQELTGDAAVVTRFHQEVKTRRAFEHPNVLRRVAEGISSDGRPFLVSEPVGDSLATLLATRGPMDVERALRIGVSVCDALQFLHVRGHVHGNIKPATLFVPKGAFHPKVVDFGLALLRPGRTLQGPRSRILVEPEYLAPERVRGQRGTIASDIYSVGVLLYELLTGFPPFTSPDSTTTRRMQLDEVPPALPESASELTAVLHRCLAKAPADRFPDVQSLRAALVEDLEGTVPLAIEVSPDVVMEPVEHERFGPWELMQPLGEGAMGRVFLARHNRLGRTVALKLLKPELAADSDQVQRFFQEAQAVNRINHEHIVEIFDFVDDVSATGSRRVYCVMEFLRGKTLRELLQGETLAVRRVVKLMRQVAAALNAAHRVGVVHRDVKPDNIFVTQRSGAEFVKVLDFGVAKLRDQADSEALPEAPTEVMSPSSLKATSAGLVLGTPAYMAPEQALGLPFDHRVDIYAFGVVLHRLLTGEPPFWANSFSELIRRIAEDAAPELPDKTPSGELIPRALHGLVHDCLQKDPQRRPQSMGDVGTALEGVLLETTTASTRVGPAMDFGTSIRKAPTRWRLPAAVVGGLLAASGATWVLSGRGEEAQVSQETTDPSAHVADGIDARAFGPEDLIPDPQEQEPNRAKATGPALGRAPSRAQPGVTPARLDISIVSRPAGATIVRNGQVLGKTPLTMRVSSRSPFVVTAKLRGHSPASVRVDPSTTFEPVVLVLRRDAPAERPSPPPKKKVQRDDTLDPFKR